VKIINLKKIKKITILILVPILFLACTRVPEKKPVQNIILLIGDGMGIAQIYAGMTANHGHLSLERCTSVGLNKTYSANRFITDSGAGATALACGIKTKNGSIAVDTSGLPVKSILEYAEDNGLSTGLVSTSSITHPTPASFIAHQVDRGDYEAIAADFLKTKIEIFIGGGKNNFSMREDSLNLLDSLESRGYQVVNDIKDIDYEHERIACLTAENHNPSILDGRGNMLPDATAATIHFLDNKKTGFFLMVEGSQIDWAASDTSTEGVITEMLDFDRAVKTAIDFAEKNGNTLVIVTGDHETGGMSITGGDFSTGTVDADFGEGGHTAVMIPVFAFGPKAENFSGIYENTDIFQKMMKAFGFR
jgi:alkaline phosphatase